MSIEGEHDLAGLLRAGRLVRLVLDELRRQVRPGQTTAALDAIAAELLASHGARSAPQLVYDFPGATCISVNDEIVHGIPGPRIIQAGDLVKLDVTVEIDGYMADAAVTVPVEPVTPLRRALCACVESALQQALAVVRAGQPLTVIGRAVEAEVRRYGFRILPELTGHGIGRTIHEPPTVPNYEDRRLRGRLTNGLVITIEPLITAGVGRLVEMADGWTLRTIDGRPSAHAEHTIVVRQDGPLILTAA